MNETPEETTTTKLKVDAKDVVIATTAVVLTVGALHVVSDLAAIPLRKLTSKLNRKAEELKTD